MPIKTELDGKPFYRDPISLDGASILITGATGSFGSQFVRTVLERYAPARVVIFSRDELKQQEMAQALDPLGKQSLRFFIGDVRDRDRLEMAMHGIDYVVHAAALKQVPTAEYNPFECIHTNVLGAENVVQAAMRSGVKKVLALSTDKAANPINLYGASKLASDKIFVAANNLSGTRATRFSVVRYGNVFGSRGSVIPLYQRLIAGGAKTLPITDASMTRFWITIQQGVDFVLSRLNEMDGGEIYVPKIPSGKIVDIARAMAPGCEHEIIGIRPGEKLHEIMISEDDGRLSLEFDDHYLIKPAFVFWEKRSEPTRDGQPVTAGFSYTSGDNAESLEPSQLESLLAQLPNPYA